MLHILLTLLKLIGIIVLTILGVLILLLLIVLFVPVRYEIKADSKGELKKANLSVKFSWLLHLISGCVTYEDEILDWKLRVLWKTFLEKDELVSKPSVEETVESATEEAVEETSETIKNQFSSEKSENVEEESIPEDTEESEPESTSKESKLDKLKYTITKVCDKIKMVIEFLQVEAHKATLVKAKKEFIKLLVSLKPKKLKGKIRFGMEDPYKTGQILAILSVLYPFYGESVEIYPEFDQKVLEGDIYIKGHIRVLYAARMAFNIIIDKNVWTTIKDVKTLL